MLMPNFRGLEKQGVLWPISAAPVRGGCRIIFVALVGDGCRISVAPVRDGHRISPPQSEMATECLWHQ